MEKQMQQFKYFAKQCPKRKSFHSSNHKATIKRKDLNSLIIWNQTIVEFVSVRSLEAPNDFSNMFVNQLRPENITNTKLHWKSFSMMMKAKGFNCRKLKKHT